MHEMFHLPIFTLRVPVPIKLLFVNAQQIIADIFNTDVYILEATANSASLGGAYRAKHALMPEGTKFSDVVRDAPAYKHAVSPSPENHKASKL